MPNQRIYTSRSFRDQILLNLTKHVKMMLCSLNTRRTKFGWHSDDASPSSVVSRETTLIKYILKNINIYGT